ncbi:MAG: methyltransferase domain-containing protein [Bacteroidales bacterium]|nr:methyltransferase domain-containing protein [Bacteroidales bacterium]
MSDNDKFRFRFKQFGINDSECAMKIGTDGVLLGAWTNIEQSHNILDVGSGSGLISLMIAQRSSASITGIEIDKCAAKQSIENINDSPWSNRISIINSDFIKWASISHNINKFDHIVSNPPFFNNGPISTFQSRAIARHNNSLGYEQLIKLSKRLLTDDGKLSIISPIERKDDIIFYSELEQMFISRLTNVYSKEGGKITRILWEFSKIKCATEYASLSIRNINNSFSQEYVNLTTEFYLNF